MMKRTFLAFIIATSAAANCGEATQPAQSIITLLPFRDLALEEFLQIFERPALQRDRVGAAMAAGISNARRPALLDTGARLLTSIVSSRAKSRRPVQAPSW